MLWRCLLAASLSLVALPLLALFLAALTSLMLLLRRASLTLSTQAITHEAESRAPINEFFSAIHSGAWPIRVYSQQAFMLSKFCSLVDRNGCALFTVEAASRWLAFYLDCLVGLYLVALLVGVVALSPSVSRAAVSLSISMELAGLFHYLVTVTAHIANSLTSVRRIRSLTNLPS